MDLPGQQGQKWEEEQDNLARLEMRMKALMWRLAICNYL